MASDDYCEMCDLPLSTCVHGRPEPAPAPRAAPAPRVRTTRAAPRVAPRVAGSPSTAATARTAPRKWTQPHEFVPYVVAVLQDAGGELPAEEVFAELETRMDSVLRSGDRETNPQGELRWRAAARKARKELMDSGVMAAAGPGVWRLDA